MLISKSRIFSIIPAAVQIPLRYWLHAVLGLLEPELQILPDLLRSGEQAIDIGANKGIYTYRLRKHGLRVHAFEPNSSCAEVLSHWGKYDQMLSVHTNALGDRIGTVILQIPIDSQGHEHNSSSSIKPNAFQKARCVNVNITTLDSFRFSNISFIKIDVEGAEYEVLKGAMSTLLENAPALLVEIERRHANDSFLSTFDLLEANGYLCFFLKDGYLKKIDQFDEKSNQCLENLGSSSGAYINNFLFLHKKRLDSEIYSKFLDRWLTK